MLPHDHCKGSKETSEVLFGPQRGDGANHRRSFHVRSWAAAKPGEVDPVGYVFHHVVRKFPNLSGDLPESVRRHNDLAVAEYQTSDQYAAVDLRFQFVRSEAIDHMQMLCQ